MVLPPGAFSWIITAINLSEAPAELFEEEVVGTHCESVSDHELGDSGTRTILSCEDSKSIFWDGKPKTSIGVYYYYYYY